MTPLNRNHLPSVEPCYAVKANSSGHIINLLIQNNVGFDVASENEMKLVIEKGVAKDKLVYANPTRPMEHLKFAKDNGVDLLVFDHGKYYKVLLS